MLAGCSPVHHSRMLEGPIYMWGCNHLYQDRVLQPCVWPNLGWNGSKVNECYFTKATSRVQIGPCNILVWFTLLAAGGPPPVFLHDQGLPVA
jgi:hypothetical protein